MQVQSSLRSEADVRRERTLLWLSFVAGVVYALIKLSRYVLFGWVNVLVADFLDVAGPSPAVVQASAFMEAGGLVSTVAMAAVLFVRPLGSGKMLMWSTFGVSLLAALLYRLPRSALVADLVFGLLGLGLTSVDSIASGPYVLEVLRDAPKPFVTRGMFITNVSASLATVLQGMAVVLAELQSWDAVCLAVAACMAASGVVQIWVAVRAAAAAAASRPARSTSISMVVPESARA